MRYAWNLLDLFKVEFIWIGLVRFDKTVAEPRCNRAGITYREDKLNPSSL
ncbi:hypothetical protein EV14_0964 [Prochlorococcus sp. MIT 0703]|nr:hypothetical protein EV14_0964 [Prochlorococcus sp. MIT 0703]